jgi:SAM-dependent methyltransferase
LSRIFKPLQEYVPPPATGLDFGSGPGPTLAAMCQEAGYDIKIFDPFYAPNPDIWNAMYDFITCTEVVEHMRRPGKTLFQIWDMLRPDGWLGIMTKLIISREAFVNWHYIRDPTHICFFSRATFFWLASTLQARILFCEKDVIFLNKPV